jgi:hypothetical protein
MDDVFFTSKGPRNASHIRRVEGGSHVRQTELGWEMRTLDAETWTSIDHKPPATDIVAVMGGWQSRSRWTNQASRPIISGARCGICAMNTAFLLMAQYGGEAIIPIEDVCKDYFSHLNATKLVQKYRLAKLQSRSSASKPAKNPLRAPILPLSPWISTRVLKRPERKRRHLPLERNEEWLRHSSSCTSSV